MAEFHTALSVSVEEDLLPLSALLHQRGVSHRVFEDGGQQVLEVVDESLVPQVQALYQAWRNEEVSIELSKSERPSAPSGLAEQARSAPVTLGLIALSVCGFLVIFLGPLNPLAGYLTFTPFEVTGDQLVFGSMGGQYWRLVSPVFLHFGWMHIVFNSLWMWDLGQKVESVMGHFNMLMLFLAIAIISNVCQYLFGGPGLFGGMSGVVYGMLGFAWVGPLLQPRWLIQPSKTIMLFMVGWLVLCLMGVIEVLGFGAIANAAHIGGLVSGAALGAVFGLSSRLGGDKS